MLKLHMEAFKNGGEIRNPLARALVHRRYEKSDELDAAFTDMMRLRANELREKRPDLPTLLGIAEDEFWPFVDDEEVWFAAQRGRALTHTVRNPLALILLKATPREDSDELAQTLRELREGSAGDSAREILAKYYENIPAELDLDDDVRMAASRAYFYVREPWMRKQRQPPPDQRR